MQITISDNMDESEEEDSSIFSEEDNENQSLNSEDNSLLDSDNEVLFNQDELIDIINNGRVIFNKIMVIKLFIFMSFIWMNTDCKKNLLILF